MRKLFKWTLGGGTVSIAIRYWRHLKLGSKEWTLGTLLWKFLTLGKSLNNPEAQLFLLSVLKSIVSTKYNSAPL